MPASPKARELVAEIAKQIEDYEAHFGLRERKRKAADQATFEATIAAVVSDLSMHLLSGQQGSIAVTRRRAELSRRSRYRPPAENKQLPRVLDAMASPELGLARMTLGWHDLEPRPDRERYRQTTIATGPVLMSWIERDGISLADFGRSEAEEIILLKGTKPKRGEETPSHIEPRAPLIEYDDSSPDHPSHRARAELRRINAWIATADISLAEAIPGVDLSQRRLRRHFTQGSFKSGGRLFGGFWQTMERKRRSVLRINGEPIVTLDYQAMFINLAYARMGVQLRGDPYVLPGWEAHRAGIKKVMASALFSYRPIGRTPQGTREMLPAGVPHEDVMDAIMQRHRPMKFQFAFETGHYLMFEESEIIVSVLSRLLDLGVVALPLHDALCVAASDAELARRVMVEAYRDRVGRDIELSLS